MRRSGLPDAARCLRGGETKSGDPVHGWSSSTFQITTHQEIWRELGMSEMRITVTPLRVGLVHLELDVSPTLVQHIIQGCLAGDDTAHPVLDAERPVPRVRQKKHRHAVQAETPQVFERKCAFCTNAF